MDRLDARILLALDDEPDATSLAVARRLGVARNTVAARLQRLRSSGALREPSRRIDPAHLGRPLVAFTSVELSQPSGDAAIAALCEVPEVVEAHATTGQADVLLKVVARDTTDLHRITGRLIAVPGVVRMDTVVSLHEHMPVRVRSLLEQLAEEPHPRAAR
jgi:DNA-binding Lrp family transcriptional regulator